ncbi:MAG: sodium-dependent transporter, partial [Gammaproteobacteria bacterium]|nr:sodium-dependent transporter [Gammaproteobacteria bacterium]
KTEVINGVEQTSFTGEAALTALGHAFFTLSLGMGAIMVYGSYMPKKTSIAGSTFLIAIADTAVALLAGMAIFPIVFANGLEPGAGPGLIFQTLPIAFGAMPGGQFFGTIFFVLLVVAAWSSSISIIEPAVAWLVENRGKSRTYAAAVLGVIVWVVGLGTVFSFNIWSGEEYQLFGKTIFDLLDYLTSNIMLPLGGMLIAIFATWCMRKESIESELAMKSGFNTWYFIARYISPVAVFIVFLNAIGVF